MVKFTKKFQAGGAVMEDPAAQAPMEGGAPVEGAPQGGSPEDMLMQLAQMAMQALQNQDCQAAMAVCQGFVQMIQGMQGGGAPEGEPVYKKGGKLSRRLK